jgi:hypothetical protein
MYHRVTQMTEDGRPPREAPEPKDEPSPASSEAPREQSRKERVLHTRVPAVLERELKRFADNLRVPVSNLVRTILEDAVNVADAGIENVEVRLKRAAAHIGEEREKLKKRVATDPLDGVFAFQEVRLAQTAKCAKCSREMKRGDKAHLGLNDSPLRAPDERVFICDACLPAE